MAKKIGHHLWMFPKRQTSSKVLKPKTANSTAQITLMVKELADRGKTDMIDGAFCDKISVSLT